MVAVIPQKRVSGAAIGVQLKTTLTLYPRKEIEVTVF